MARRDIRKRPDAKDLKPPQAKKEQPELEAPQHQIDQGAEVSSQESASQLGSAVGNADLQRMLADSGRLSQESMADQDHEQDLEQESSLESEEGLAEYLSALGAPAHQSSGRATEDWQRLLGGDPEDEPPVLPPKLHFSRRRRIPAVTPGEDGERPVEPELELGLLPALGPPSAPRQDELLDALWAWMQSPTSYASAELSPEDLARRPGELDRAAAMGRFLQDNASVPLSRWMARLARALPGPRSGSQILARAALLAELSALALARSLGVPVVNRACALALEQDVAPRAVRAAQLCLEQRRLAANLVLDVAMHGQPQAPTVATPTGKPGLMLLEQALRSVALPKPIVSPGSHASPSDSDLSADESTEAVDALMAHLLGGECAPSMDAERLGPVLDGADDLLLFSGRAQVELAGAAIAVARVAGEGVRVRVGALLRSADRQLRGCARRIAAQAGQLDQLQGRPYHQALQEVRASEATLGELCAQLRRLREASFGALAWAVTADMSQPCAPTLPPAAQPLESRPTEELLKELERTPLLGPGLERAARLEATLQRQSGDPGQRARLLWRQGQRLSQLQHAAAPEVLASAVSALRRAELDPEPARLDVVMALLERGQRADARALLSLIELAAPPRCLRLGMARLALGDPVALSEVRAALGQGAPCLLLHARELLAEAMCDTGRHLEAEQHLEQAQVLASHHRAQEAWERLQLARGVNWMRAGKLKRAATALRACLKVQDRLVRMAALALLAGLGEPNSPALRELAEQHRSWTAWQLAALDEGGDLEQDLTWLRAQGEPGALLQAGLLERAPGQRS